MLDEWAIRWSIPREALLDLRLRMGVVFEPRVSVGEDGSESRQQSLVRVEAAKLGISLFRNNVGALLDERGVPVRYGLANESKEQNKQVKSADLIGIKPVLIGPQHVGTVIGQFVSREVKHQTWKWKGDKHEQAQMRWAQFVVAKGGDAAFCTGTGSFMVK